MDERLQQRTRYVLRSRIRQAQTCPIEIFERACSQLLVWLDNHSVFGGIIGELERVYASERARLSDALKKVVEDGHSDSTASYAARTVLEHCALCLHVVRCTASLAEIDPWKQGQGVQFLARFIRPGANLHKSEECVEVIRDVALDGLFEFLDEQLASRNGVFGLLGKYKQRSEWFLRNELRDKAEADSHGRAGERALAADLHLYLLDQGVDFTIEPTSVSGEADLLLRDADGRYVIVDAKYVDSEAADSVVKAKLSNGFHQVFRYCEDFDEPSGFLVPFVTGARRLAPGLEEVDGVRFLRLGGRLIYYLPIFIGVEPSASKSGKARELVISEAELKSVSGGEKSGS